MVPSRDFFFQFWTPGGGWVGPLDLDFCVQHCQAPLKAKAGRVPLDPLPPPPRLLVPRAFSKELAGRLVVPSSELTPWAAPPPPPGRCPQGPCGCCAAEAGFWHRPEEVWWTTPQPPPRRSRTQFLGVILASKTSALSTERVPWVCVADPPSPQS